MYSLFCACQDFGMEAELMNLALLSTTEDKIDAAKLVNNDDNN